MADGISGRFDVNLNVLPWGQPEERRQDALEEKKKTTSRQFYTAVSIIGFCLLGGFVYSTIVLIRDPDNETSFEATFMLYLTIILFSFLVPSLGYLFRLPLIGLFRG